MPCAFVYVCASNDSVAELYYMVVLLLAGRVYYICS